MSAIPCTYKIDCPGSDFPISNYSAEGPEQVPTFLSLVFPESWDKQGCLSLCESTVSQEAANLCALAQAAACNPPSVFDFNDDGDEDGDDGGGTFPVLFFNAAQDCSEPCPDGSAFSFTTPAATFSSLSQAAADARAEAYACQRARDNQICIGDISSPGFCAGASYSETVSILIASGATPITVSLIDGTLPEGIDLTNNNSSFTLSGSTFATGQYDFRIRVQDAASNQVEKDFSLFVVDITQDSLPDAVIGNAYSTTLTTSGPTQGTVTWSILSGGLPTGLSLNPATGEISGTPTVEGTFTFVIAFDDER